MGFLNSGGVEPEGATGYELEFREGLEKRMRFLGRVIGRFIILFTVIVLGFDLALNSIFMFANSGQNGVNLPLYSPGFWVILLISPATTGIQYALFDARGRGSGLGYTLGWVIAILDTVMDGSGFLAWLESMRGQDLIGTDSSHMLFNTFPTFNMPWWEWMWWGVMMALCFFHERFLELFLRRKTFAPSPDAGAMALEIAILVEKAGKIFKKVKLNAISWAPYIMFALDMMLFAQSVRGQYWGITASIYFASLLITVATMMVWERYFTLREEGYKVMAFKAESKHMQLNRKYRLIFMGAIGITLADSIGDLKGFNQLIFGDNAGFIPYDWRLAVPFLLTAGLVLTMTTAFEPMNSQLFSPLVALSHIGLDEGEEGPDGGESPMDGPEEPGSGGDFFV